MVNLKKIIYLGSFLILLFTLTLTLFLEQYFLPLSFIIIFSSCLPFFLRFEKKDLRAEEVILIAVLASIAAVSRVPFAPIPSVQPTSFVIIMAALVFGSETGFMVGSIAAIVSNIFLGQGPWTPWQMFCWGMMGFTAGLLRNKKWMKSIWGKSIFGFIWGFLFGWIMNLWFIIGFFENIDWKVFFSVYLSSFYFDLAHGLSNVFFIIFFSKQWLKILGRVKIKYGLLK